MGWGVRISVTRGLNASGLLEPKLADATRSPTPTRAPQPLCGSNRPWRSSRG